MSTTTSGQIGAVGSMVLALENPPWDTLYRVGIGYFIMPVYHRLLGGGSAWTLFAFFMAVLLALRVVPGITRRVLPFPREVKSVWAERRALAKRYDSYQWRKLFGLGLGWFACLLVSGEAWPEARLLAGACVLAGTAGLAFWSKRSRGLAAQTSAGAPGAA